MRTGKVQTPKPAPRLKSLLAVSASALSLLASGAAHAQGPVQSYGGEVDPSYGHVSPFYGNVSPFWGNVSPFWGNVSPFYGNVSPFYGNVSPFYGNVSPFWGNVSPFWGPTNNYFQSAAQIDQFFGAYSSINNQINLTYNAMQCWFQSVYYGPIDTSKYTIALNQVRALYAYLGGPASPAATSLFNKYNVNMGFGPLFMNGSNPLFETQYFILDAFDVAVSEAKLPHVDYWMSMVNWSPALTAIQGSGAQTRAGIIDFTPSHTPYAWGGYNYQSDEGHGTAVSNIIAAKVSTNGVMGIAPGTIIQGYNPFDASGTASWADVSAGLIKLGQSGNSVINMSLGEPGSLLGQNLSKTLQAPAVEAALKSSVLVIAAGNSGVSQSTAYNTPWSPGAPTLIFVGSVNPDGTISNFSNRPGEACLFMAGGNPFAPCAESNKLKYRFIVAPGDLILVDDNNGGVTRQSGTSFAAPMVTGAIALLQTRWPWLAQHPAESAQIILQSATPMGANPGADPVFGVGLLNIQASQSPLNYSNLTYYAVNAATGQMRPMPLSVVTASVKSGNQSAFDAQNLYFSAFEPIGSTYRDFQIPLASQLVGQVSQTNGGLQMFQSYLTSGFATWAASHFAGGGQTAPLDGHAFGFAQSSAPVGSVAGLEARVKMAPIQTAYGFTATNVQIASELDLSNRLGGLRLGFGQGASALDGHTGLGFGRDYDPSQGGANPLLGLASGGAFADLHMTLTPKLAISAGVTDRRDRRDFSDIGAATPTTGSGAGVYAASAQHLGVDVAVSPNAVVRLGLTRLSEANAILGVQSMDPSTIAHGSTSLGRSIGFDVSPAPDLILSATRTDSETATPGSSAYGLATGPGGLKSNSAEIALSKANLFTDNDAVRLSISEPMHVVEGRLVYTSIEVVNRQTGALGAASQSVSAAKPNRPVALEGDYTRPFLHDGAQLTAFARFETGAQTDLSGVAPSSTVTYFAGAKLRVAF